MQMYMYMYMYIYIYTQYIMLVDKHVTPQTDSLAYTVLVFGVKINDPLLGLGKHW